MNFETQGGGVVNKILLSAMIQSGQYTGTENSNGSHNRHRSGKRRRYSRSASLPPAEVWSSQFIHIQLQTQNYKYLGMYYKHNYNVLQKVVLYKPK